MYNLYCTVDSVPGTAYRVKCTVYCLPFQCTVYSVQFTVYRLHFTVFSLQCTVDSVHFTVYNVQCIECSEPSAVHRVQCNVQRPGQRVAVQCCRAHFQHDLAKQECLGERDQQMKQIAASLTQVQAPDTNWAKRATCQYEPQVERSTSLISCVIILQH